MCGQWLNPEELTTGSEPNVQGISCDLGTNNDEIGHVTLIPVGEHQGRLLVWTRTDDRLARQGVCPYKSHVIELTGMGWKVKAQMDFEGALPPVAEGDGPFCTGHTWMTDAFGNPKFLLAGGIRHVTGSPSSRQVYWFDPLDSSSGANQWWYSGPDELPEPSWYPSVLTYLTPSGDRFLPLAVGGASQLPVTCSTLYREWWTMSLAPDVWSVRTDVNAPVYFWEGYPRTFFIADPNAPWGGEVFSAGHDVACDTVGDPSLPYASNPCNRIKTSLSNQEWRAGPDPNDACDPGEPDCIWGWNSNHGAMLHTLKPNWDFDSIDGIDQYDLNRIYMTGGNREEPEQGDDPEWRLAYSYTLGWTGSAWTKLPEPEPRTFANFTLLPDGKIMLLGGQTEFRRGGPSTADNQYWTTANRFDPDTATWQPMATMRPHDGVASLPTPRGYHAVSILLPDGSVALLGGQKVSLGLLANADTQDTAEVFQPPYFFNGTRPAFIAVPQTIQYNELFTVRVALGATASGGSSSPPGGGLGPPTPIGPPETVPIASFCLMGLGSVTHHFDYGQRYVELMWEPVTNNKFTLRAPPKPSMAPDGYYMLFAVDELGRPTVGKFIRITF